MTRYPKRSGDQPIYERQIPYSSSEPSYPRSISYQRQQADIQPRHINYSATPISKISPPSACRLVIKLPPKPIEPLPIIELLALFLSSKDPITLQLAESPLSVEAAFV